MASVTKVTRPRSTNFDCYSLALKRLAIFVSLALVFSQYITESFEIQHRCMLAIYDLVIHLPTSL